MDDVTVRNKHCYQLCLTKDLRVSVGLPSVNESSVPKIFLNQKRFISWIIMKISAYNAFSYILVRTQIVCSGPRVKVALKRPEVNRQISSKEHKKASQA
jgi:hypothetical protein